MTDGYKIKRVLIWQGGVEKQIYPAGWKPNANTVAYFPFVDDILDKKGNYTLSNNGNSKDTIGYKFTSYALINIPDDVTPKTSSVWIKPISIGNNTYSDTAICTLPNFTGYYIHHLNSNFNQKYLTFTNSSYAAETASVSVSFNQRYLFTTVYDGSKSYGYINGVKILESNPGYRWAGSPVWFWGDSVDGHSTYYNGQCVLSEGIVETVPRTAEEIQAYYNQTKSNYGL